MKRKRTKKIKEGRKAVNGILVQVGTLVAMFAPQASEQYQAAVGVIGSILTALTVYYTTNHQPEEAA
ncbi:MAG TPA: hypothetical protein VFJ76_02555 [Solirubrobacterales bacterium]|nr:hypothetical protein [Solirubrobacterales bacterium]